MRGRGKGPYDPNLVFFTILSQNQDLVPFRGLSEQSQKFTRDTLRAPLTIGFKTDSLICVGT